ncbi:MAG: hypothetical protein ACF788_02960, partial [Novipirellula sp. JB048]
MITPTAKTLNASESIEFEIEPLPDGCMIQEPEIGTYDAETRIYTAPSQITEQSEVSLIVRAADETEIGRATITLMPSTPALQLTPASVELSAKQQQWFRSEPAEPLTWEESLTGKVTQEGVYTAPRWIWSPRTIVLTARSRKDAQRYAHATITLLDTPSKRLALGIYLFLLGGLLIGAVVGMWGSLHSPIQTPQVRISPPIVTLKAKEKLDFAASVTGSVEDDTATFHWTKSDNGVTDNGVVAPVTGVYTAPNEFLERERVAVTARRDDQSGSSATAIVLLSETKSLRVLPSELTARAAQEFSFVARLVEQPNQAEEPAESDRESPSPKIQWSVEPKLGQISQEGVFRAPAVISETQTLTVLAQLEDEPHIQAGANITLIASVASHRGRKVGVLLFVLLMGALGSLLHSV